MVYFIGYALFAISHLVGLSFDKNYQKSAVHTANIIIILLVLVCQMAGIDK